VNGEHKVGDSAAPRALLKESDLASLLGVSERKLKDLRASGLVPDPIELGPRAHRWTHDDYLETLRRLPRSGLREEPPRLSQGRRARIEALKAAGQGA
jgi:predicted DNA-binding transcriptional regulator AlpA